jgi:DNA mismatch repair ATPase MutS
MVCFNLLFQFSADLQPGLELARLADLPADVLTEAQRVATSLTETDLHDKEQSQTSKISIRRKALLRVTPSVWIDTFVLVSHRVVSFLLLASDAAYTNPGSL